MGVGGGRRLVVHGRLVEEDVASIYFTHIKIYQGKGCFFIKTTYQQKLKEVKKLQDEN